MSKLPRREFLRRSAGAVGAAAALAVVPESIRRALAIPATVETGTIQDVKHVVIVMQENRSFDHYFGTLRGVCGFGDPFPIPLASGEPVWSESNGTAVIPPYHLNPEVSSALLVPDMPHNFPDAQAAWNQGSFGEWPRYKTDYSMGYYKRADLPFQFALAEAFTLCDGYHCAVTTCTDPNRIVFMSGANADPALVSQGINCTAANAEVTNVRCLVSGEMPSPGYTYSGSAFTWPTLPELLQAKGVSWRIYQDPNNNWTGLMHGGLAFKNFREATAASGSALYEKGMTLRTVQQLQEDVADGNLPTVSWIFPSSVQSEHPLASNPNEGAYFLSQVLDAITSNPTVWSQTAVFITFDENDGLFDHVPPPAVPSYGAQGSLAGGSTLSVAGEYFDGSSSGYLNPTSLTGSVRPWGMGARVPMYVVSPWSRGGWVNSQVFDHTSIGMFLEKRFGIAVDSVSPWRRAVSGDLTSAFDFASPNDAPLPSLPNMSNYAAVAAAQAKLPLPVAPAEPQSLYQERGIRSSRALPYILNSAAAVNPDKIEITFSNAGTQGVVFHVYDRLHLDRIPRRYTIEVGKQLSDLWYTSTDAGDYDLWVYGPNGFVRTYSGNTTSYAAGSFRPEILANYHAPSELVLEIRNSGAASQSILVAPNNPFVGAATQSVTVAAEATAYLNLSLVKSGNWYDFTASAANVQRRFAGRMETGKDGISNPAFALNL